MVVQLPPHPPTGPKAQPAANPVRAQRPLRLVQPDQTRPFDSYAGALPEAELARRMAEARRLNGLQAAGDAFAAVRAERARQLAALEAEIAACAPVLPVRAAPRPAIPAEAPCPPIAWSRPPGPDLGRAAWWAAGVALALMAAALLIDGLQRGAL